MTLPPTIFLCFLRIGGGRWDWHDIIIVLLAVVIVCPDHVLDWISDLTGRPFIWSHVVLLAVVAIGGTIAATALLMPLCRYLHWWDPILYVGYLIVFRFVYWLIIKAFRFDE